VTLRARLLASPAVTNVASTAVPEPSAHPILAPLYVKRVSFPPRECAPVLAGVKQTSLDTGCGPAGSRADGNGLKDASACWLGPGVGLLAAGPGSDFSEEPVQGSEPATLEPVAVPMCPPGPVALALRASSVIWR
jgi:hypothetical protein